MIAILKDEVAPVLEPNLLEVAGEWAMFDPDWVVDRVSAYLAHGSKRRTLLARHWPALERILKGESIEQAVTADRSRARLLLWVFGGAMIAMIAWRLIA